MFSLRAQDWTPFQRLDFCARHRMQVVHFSEIRQIGGLDPDHLRRVRDYAAERGIRLEIGMRSIAAGASIFDAAEGTPEAQLLRMIEAARLVGSPIVRCVVGRFVDRTAPGGIEARIAEAVEVLREVRPRALDAGVRIAVENHAGDMQARELRQLVEEAGPEVVGVCLDSGNPLWALEDPHVTLEMLAPYVLTSHVRDGAVWMTDEGIAVAWTRMGEGTVGIDAWVRAYLQKCPGRPLSLEVIVQDAPRVFEYREPGFWEGYRRMPAWEFARFLTLAERGAPPPAHTPGTDGSAASLEIAHVEASIAWTRKLLEGT